MSRGVIAVAVLLTGVACVEPYHDFGDSRLPDDSGVELVQDVTLPDEGIELGGVDLEAVADLEVRGDVGWDGAGEVGVDAGADADGGADLPDVDAGADADGGADLPDGDADNDGYLAEEAGGDDCDDTNDSIHPGAVDMVGDDIDQDCDGIDGTDGDLDGFPSVASGGSDCDDTNPAVHPGADDFVAGACSDLQALSTSEFVDSEGNTGYYSAAAADSDGALFVAYRTKDPTKVMLATRAAGAGGWSFYVVHEGSGQYISLALGAGKVHVAFYDESACKCLRYAVAPVSDLGSGFSKSVVDDDAGEVGRYASVKVDSKGFVHIAYWDKTKNDLKYATDATGSFVPVVVSGTDLVGGEEEKIGQFASLALDAADNAHIATYFETGASLAYLTNKSGQWLRDIKDESGQDVGKYTSIGIDGNGAVHISYRYSSEEDLRYATNSSGVWKTTTIDGENMKVGSYTSLAIDKDDKVHISYNQGDLDYLRYATNKPGQWVSAVVHSADKAGLQTSIALAPDGKAHIFSGHDALGKLLHVEASLDCLSYGDGVDANCDGVDGVDEDGDGFASLSSGGNDCDDQDPALQPAWVTTVLDGNPSVGEYASLAIDAVGGLHAGYYGALKKDLLYAHLDPGAKEWSTETADGSSNDVGQYCSTAVSGNGDVHVAYYDSTANELLHAVKVQGQWSAQVVEGTPDGGNVGTYASIAVDEKGVPHIAYHDEMNGLLRYATKPADVWESHTIPNVQKAGRFTSIAVNKGKVYIAYQAIDDFDLMLAEGSGDTWNVETVDADGIVGEAASLAFDGSSVHIAYRNSTKTTLSYAVRTAAGWSLWTVDDLSKVGKWISVALDSNKMVHIAYKDQAGDELRYASNVVITNGQWAMEPAHGSDGATCGGVTGQCGAHVSLRFDPMGSLRAVHYDEANKHLLYSRKFCLGY